MKPAFSNSRTPSTIGSTSGPQAIDPATSSSRTNCVAPANPAGPGSSALTFQPPANQRNCSCARCTAASRSVPHDTGSCAILRAGGPSFVASHSLDSSAFGSTAIIASATGANRLTDCEPDTATPIGVRFSGRSHSFTESTRKCLPS